ncbi:hypothetical protein GW17_00051636, partial [Ensete ventricosum]
MGTVRTRQYVVVRQLTDTWTAHYRAVPPIRVVSTLLSPEIDREKKQHFFSPRRLHGAHGLLAEASRGRFFSLRGLLGEKTFLLPAQGEETSPCVGRTNEM